MFENEMNTTMNTEVKTEEVETKKRGRCYNRFDTKNLVDGVIEFIKYAPTKKEITEWYVSRRRKCKEVYLKKLEEVTKELEEI